MMSFLSPPSLLCITGTLSSTQKTTTRGPGSENRCKYSISVMRCHLQGRRYGGGGGEWRGGGVIESMASHRKH